MAPGAPPQPRTLEEVTPAWLTEALGRAGRLPAGEVEGVEMERIGAGRGFASLVARVRMSYSRHAPGAPASAVVKLPAEDAAVREYAGSQGMYRRETCFYARVAESGETPAPGCYFAGFDNETGGFALLLEDVRGAREGDEITGCTLDEASSAMRALGRLHGRWWNDPGLGRQSWLSAPFRPPDLQRAYLDAWARSAGVLAAIYPPETLEIARRLGPRLAEFLGREPAARTLVHGDFHPGNLLFRGDGVVALDWQNVAFDAPGRDTAYFLQGSLGVEDRRARETGLLALYRQTLHDSGVNGYTEGGALEDYRRGLLLSLVPSVLSVANLEMDAPGSRRLIETVGARMIAVADWHCGDLVPG